MSNILEELKNYFRETPQDEIMRKWEEYAKYDKVGPPVLGFIKQTNLFYKIEQENTKLKQINLVNLIKNPNCYSDFCI